MLIIQNASLPGIELGPKINVNNEFIKFTYPSFVSGIVKWSYIETFYNIDKNNLNFVFAPALTEQHLKPNIKEKMRVKLAAQVLSHSVTAGILAKIASSKCKKIYIYENESSLSDKITPDLKPLTKRVEISYKCL